MTGEEDMDSVPSASAVVRTPSHATWDSKGATVCYKRVVINLCNGKKT